MYVVDEWVKMNIECMASLTRFVNKGMKGKRIAYEESLTEYFSKISSTILNLLDIYASTSSLTYGSCSIYTPNVSFSSICDLIALRE